MIIQRDKYFAILITITLLLLISKISLATDFCGDIPTSTWTAAGNPYVITCGSQVRAGVTLRIEAGTLVQFAANGSLGVQGVLDVFGTASNRVVFTSNSATPTPGSWRTIYFYDSGRGNIRYADILYAGSSISVSGITVQNSSLVYLDHVTVAYTEGHGVSIESSATWATVSIKNCSFVGNTSGGIINAVAGRTFDLTLNWWNAANGPSGAGPGSGQSVGSNLTFEPWLTAPPSSPQYFSSASATNTTFNPSIPIIMDVTFTTVLSGDWTILFKNSSGTVVRTITGTGQTANVSWDGTNDSGVLQPTGNYTYEAQSLAGADYAAPIGGRSILSNTPVTFSNLTTTPAAFSPNGNAVQETTTFTASANYSVAWTLNVRNASSGLVRSTTGQGTSVSYVWDGNDSAGMVQSDGVYTFELVAFNGASATKTVILDNTLPTAVITTPPLGTGQWISNVLLNGVTNIEIIGTADDLNFNNWDLDWALANPNATWNNLNAGTAPIVNSRFSFWETGGLAQLQYKLRLRVWDKAGNLREYTGSAPVGHFTMTQNATQLTGGGTVTYTSKVPFTLDQTVNVGNESGQVVRILFSGQRGFGTYNDVWDGKSASGGVLPDGVYFISSLLTSGSASFTWDQISLGSETWLSCYYASPSSDPFNNQPMTFSYNFAKAGRVIFALSPTYIPGGVPATCDPPNICPMNGKYQEAGPHTITWAGVDSTGVFRPDIQAYSLCSNRWSFAPSAIVLYGTAPVIANDLVTVTPPFFQPERGTQIVSFTVSSYQSQPVTITVTFFNQASLSTLRTITLNGVSPGPQAIEWDGRADNGMRFAPGNYTVTLTVTDSIGNVVKSQILTTIRY